MKPRRADRLNHEVEPGRDHVLGGAEAPITVVEYGSYVCPYCHAAHEVIRRLRMDFGDRMRYVYRHLPLTDRADATRAAELAEYGAATTGEFWALHDTLMERGPDYDEGEMQAIASEFDIPARERWDPELARAAAKRVREDAHSGLDSGARVTPTFFINGRRYEGAWDEASLSEAMLRSLGHRLHTASVEFVRWAPSTGILLLLTGILAFVVTNTSIGPAFQAFWQAPSGFEFAGASLDLPLIDWVNDGLLTIFFLVVGLEMKRELTVGRLSSPRAAAFPIAAALGGIVVPALLFLLLAPAPFRHSWGVTISTDTAFAIALIILLGDRVPVDLRIFLTAAVIVDDLVAIAVLALFYSGPISGVWVAVAVVVTCGLMVLNRWHVYRALPYALLGIFLWFALHHAGLHATLAGVILAMVTPTRPPPNLTALLAQAQAVIGAETRLRGEAVLQTGPSEPALRQLNAVHDRIESPASKLLHAVEPWSSYFVLPVFALANVGLVWSTDVFVGRGRLIAAIVLGLVVGKFLGILVGSRLAAALKIAVKPPTFTWRQVAGTAALAGIGFTMSLFIASRSLTGEDLAAAKIGIFLASIIAGVAGALLLRWGASADELTRGTEVEDAEGERGSADEIMVHERT